MSAEPMAPLEVWAGIECTVNRVNDTYGDQLQRNGHDDRIEDLDLFASLGIRAIRYPVLWERTAPDEVEEADWAWADQRLERLRQLDILPIVGLVHHGSGPRHTSMVDPLFGEKLAEYAGAVAARYPWVTHYTPVNEPLTTARFSGLYGHWYPHGKDNRTFFRCLLNECRATILAMQAIRRVNPQAKLVQTEDLGHIFSTPLLAYQADLENERRWLSFDLLCGRVNRDHPLWDYLNQGGVEEDELRWFEENACPPDIMGINRYLTSDRLLDERLERYPAHFHGGNGQHRYADVEAVRVCADSIPSPYALLKAVWDRYHLPIAITEVHLGCTREEQLRWIKEIWDAAHQLRADGVDFRAITAWSLLGAFDWNSLLTRIDGFYEPGVFDLRAPEPRPTAIATMLRHLAQGQDYKHPLLEVPGWWRRDERLFYPPVCCVGKGEGLLSLVEDTTPGASPCAPAKDRNGASAPASLLSPSGALGANPCAPTRDYNSASSSLLSPPSSLSSPSPLLIAGATGTLGRAFAWLCEVRGIPYRLLSRKEMDITSPASVKMVLEELRPWAVVNAAGYVRVDDAEREPEVCRRINAEGAAILAEACLQHDASYVTFSSDLVFDGSLAEPYVESSEVAPLNVYGHSKAVAERWVLDKHPCSLVIRTSAFFGPWDEYNFLSVMLRSLASGDPFIAAEDAIVSPTYVPDLVNTTLDLLIDGECGLWHLANAGAISWAALAQEVASLAGLNTSNIIARPASELGWLAPRPTYSALGSERGVLLPQLDRAIGRYLNERVC